MLSKDQLDARKKDATQALKHRWLFDILNYLVKDIESGKRDWLKGQVLDLAVAGSAIFSRVQK